MEAGHPGRAARRRWGADPNGRQPGRRPVDEIMVVSARGMPEIRHRHRDMAQSIEDACLQARSYLENALDNLTRRLPDNTLDPRAEKY